MARQTGHSTRSCMPFMQPFGFVLLAACVASAASDRGLMNIDIAVAASKDIAALTSINVIHT